jgi:hypothetical protein
VKLIKTIKEISFTMSTFFCPLGFDFLIDFTMSITDSYWTTMCIFYLISATFLTLYYFFRKRIILFTCLSFLPAGYDILFKMTWDYVGSYWDAVHIFYIISAFFFLIYGIILFVEKKQRSKILDLND